MRHYLIGACLLSAVTGHSQQNTVSAGGEASGSGGTVSFTVGQTDYMTFSGSSGTISQGVQQPFEIFSVGLDEKTPEIQASLFPNPAVYSVTLNFGTWSEYPGVAYRLTDEAGRTVKMAAIDSEATTIPVNDLPDACYYLQVVSGSQIMKNFKLVKNN